MDQRITYLDKDYRRVMTNVKSFYEMIQEQKPSIKFSWRLFEDLIQIDNIKHIIIFYLEKYMNEIISSKGYSNTYNSEEANHHIIQDIIIHALSYHDKSLALYFISKHPGRFYIFSQIMRESYDDDNYEILVTMWDRLPLAQLKSEYDEKDNGLLLGHLGEISRYIIPRRNIKMLRFIYSKLPQYAIDRLTTKDFFLEAVQFNQLEAADIILSYANSLFEFTEYIGGPIKYSYILNKDKIEYLFDLDISGKISIKESFINCLLTIVVINDQEKEFDILIDRINHITKEQIENVPIKVHTNKYIKRFEEFTSNKIKN
jgi:hypothetical protein